MCNDEAKMQSDKVINIFERNIFPSTILGWTIRSRSILGCCMQSNRVQLWTFQDELFVLYTAAREFEMRRDEFVMLQVASLSLFN